eukprot:CAMPEP_0119108768 /NCGR_PEP_ID=MMETSP1180-20130426/15647_1 /TAXON_ID=3052 ORGANISM="Chlamydomonas cf sp, Strain CCMP681" /NCGR_SAMPLE_ID=MMETSP1180 /ASSEMBLY_ACC=CAM_ASM_000741 /LENGTH=418 /DNA_ID=CAMNT_0007094421 /DNA_START=76 /DNA_END=1329 /DNA_ORIENTATION=-
MLTSQGTGPNVTAPAPDPSWVATHFVQKYYDVLLRAPDHLNRFYKPDSTVSVVDAGDEPPPIRTAKGLKDIQELVNTGVAWAEAKTKHVDSQFSINGGVLLSVAGQLVFKSGLERPFTQTFFLATQENGFYVHNDILRIGAVTAAPRTASAPAAAAPTPALAAPTSNGNHAQSAPVPAVVTAPAVVEAAPLPAPPPAFVRPAAPAAAEAPASAPSPAPASKPTKAVGSPAPAAQRQAVPSPVPPSPSSWAQLVKVQENKVVAAPPVAAAVPQARVPHPVAAPQEAVATAANGQPPGAASHAAREEEGSQDQSGAHHGGTNFHCISVRNLPQVHLSLDEIQEKFVQFGRLRPGHGTVTVHNTGTGKVAYIKFEDAAGVEAALQGTVHIGDRQVEICRQDTPVSSVGFMPRGSAARGGPG